MSWTRRGVFRWHLTVRMRTFFSFRVTLSAIHQMHLHWSRCSRDSLCVSPKSSHPRTMSLSVLLSSLRSLLSLFRLRQHGRRWLESDFTPVRLRSGVDRLAIWLTRPQTLFSQIEFAPLVCAQTVEKTNNDYEKSYCSQFGTTLWAKARSPFS